MNKIYRVGAAALAAVLLLSGCGKDKESGKTKPKKTNATIRYEDYITPVVDRKVTDCISIDQINAAIIYDMQEVSSTDSRAEYYSEDGSCHLSLGLENKSRAAFDDIAADPAQWTMQTDLGEIAYWSADQTQLIAYQNGYSVSVYLSPANTISMQIIMRDILASLQ